MSSGNREGSKRGIDRKTEDSIRDCRLSPNCTFWLFPHLVKSTTYKSRLVAKLKVLGFFDRLLGRLVLGHLHSVLEVCCYSRSEPICESLSPLLDFGLLVTFRIQASELSHFLLH